RHAGARIPSGCALVCHGGVPLQMEEPPAGPLMLVAIGTPGVMQVIRMCVTLHEMGLSHLVGSILAIDLDAMMRAQFWNDLPSEFRDRVVRGSAAAFEPGLGGRSVEDVKKYLARWAVPIQTAATEVVHLHLRRTGARPGEIVPFLSLGGHAFIGVVALDTIKERLSETQLVAHIDLPIETDNRHNFLAVKQLYEQAGLKGWTISDSLAADAISNDTAITHLIAGILEAALQSGQSARLNNIYTRALPLEPGGLLAYQYVYGEVVAQQFKPCAYMPSWYYV